MDEIVTKIREQLSRHQPIEVYAYKGSEHVRTVNIAKGGKRWDTAANTLAKLDWSTLELRGRGGNVLHVIEAAEAEGPAAEHDLEDISGPRALLTAADFALVAKTIGGAVKDALANRDRETTAAINGCVAVMRETVSAFQSVQQMHRASLDAALTTRELSAGGGDPAAEALQSPKLLEMLTPLLMPQILAALQPLIAPTPAAPTAAANGVKPH